ncbi:MAG: 2-phosphosulfolactate phosphatase [Chloroflexota bacterium]|nr:MAG: 2-phosphosulfolactate phosphatase [Chloroflexota bacterium]
MGKIVAIDCFVESVGNYDETWTIVAVDVIRATTTAVTAVALGRRCFPVPAVESVECVASGLTDPLLAGELGGNMPYGFHINNSPADVVARDDIHRPMILLSTSGTRLLCSAGESRVAFAACLRNVRAQAEYLAHRHDRVAIIGAGARGEFRKEDQMCCAGIAELLLQQGYRPVNSRTCEIVERWSGASVSDIASGKSAEYLVRTGQTKDLEFVLGHIDDLEDVYAYRDGELVRQSVEVLAG